MYNHDLHSALLNAFEVVSFIMRMLHLLSEIPPVLNFNSIFDQVTVSPLFLPLHFVSYAMARLARNWCELILMRIYFRRLPRVINYVRAAQEPTSRHQILITICIVCSISVHEEKRIGRKFFLFGTIISGLSPRRVRFVVLIIRRIDSQNAGAFAQMRNEDTYNVAMTSERTSYEAVMRYR